MSESLSNVLRNIFETEISKSFPTATKDTIRVCLEYFWEDIQASCLDESRGHMTSKTFLWIPKSVLGGLVIPSLARAKWEHIDPCATILFLHLDDYNQSDCLDGSQTLQEQVADKVRSVTVSCCDSKSIVEDRVPLNLSKTMYYSTRCTGKYLDLSKDAMSSCLGEEFCSKVEELVTMSDLPCRDYLYGEKRFSDVMELGFAVFECYLMTSDCLGLCNWLALNASKHGIFIHDELDYFIDRLDGCIFKVQGQLILIQEDFFFLSALFHITVSLHADNVQVWRSTWLGFLDEFQSMVLVYHGRKDHSFLQKVVTSVSQMITRPMSKFYPNHVEIFRECEHVESQMMVSDEIKDALHDIVEHLIGISEHKDLPIDKVMIQGAISSLHDMISRCESVCEILAFKRRYQLYSNLRYTVDGMDSALTDSMDAFGMGATQKMNPYEATHVGSLTVELQEIAVLLHRSEIHMIGLLRNHLKVLSSFKRVRFLNATFLQEQPEPQIMEIQRAMCQIATDRGSSSVDCIGEKWIRNAHKIPRIKGIPHFASILIRMRYFTSLGNDLVELNPAEEKKATVHAVLHDIAKIERAWTEKASCHVKSSQGMLKDFIAVKKKNGRLMANLRKELWLSLSELFWLRRLAPLNAQQKQPQGSMYFQPIIDYHVVQSVYRQLEISLQVVEDCCPFLAPILHQRLEKIDAMALSSISWSSASLEKFLEILKATKYTFKILSDALEFIRSRINSIEFKKTEEDFLGVVCGNSWQWEDLIQAMRESLYASISEDANRSNLVISNGAQIIKHWVQSNLTHDELGFIDDEEAEKYSLLLQSEVSLKMTLFYGGMLRLALDLLLGEGCMTHGNCQARVEYQSQEPDLTLICDNIGSSLYQLQEACFKDLMQFCSPGHIEESKAVIHQHFSKLLENLKKRVISLDQVASCPEDFKSATYSRLADVLSRKCAGMTVKSRIQISSSITLVDGCSTLSPEAIMDEHVKVEIHRRAEGLSASIQMAKAGCAQLHAMINDSLCSQTNGFLPETELVASSVREQIWDLETSYDLLEYTKYMLQRYCQFENEQIEKEIASLASSIAEARLLLAPLLSKLYDREIEGLRSVKSLQEDSRSMQESIKWVERIDSYSLFDLEEKLKELDMSLDESIQQVKSDENAVKELEYLSAKFRINCGDFTTLHNAGPTLEHARDIVQSHEKLKHSMHSLASCSWIEGKSTIADYQKESSDHINHVQKLAESFSGWEMFQEYKRFVSSARDFTELMTILYSVDLKERHWKQLSFIGEGGNSLRLSKIWTEDVLNQKPTIEEIVSIAKREDHLRHSFDTIRKEWMDAKIHLVAYKFRGEVILEQSSTTDTMEKLEDAIMTLNNMISNRASSYFRDEIKSFLKDLASVEESMQIWLSTQSVWSYLEAVFDGGDIAAQLPEEAELFSVTNDTYLGNVLKASENPLLVELFQGDEVRDIFVQVLGELEKCQKSLSAYLESKRKVFPRFYFVSDSTLLEILSNGTDPRSVQKHFQSGLFDGIDHLIFESDTSNVATHIVSKEGEEVTLKCPLSIAGPAEDWLTALVEAMKDTMRLEARRAAKEVQKLPIDQFLFSRPAQMALLGLQIKWTSDVQSALYQMHLGKKNAMKKLLSAYELTLSNMVQLTLSGSLSNMQRTSLETCITIFIHLKDVIAELISKRIEDPKSFDWLKHCRFRWREDKQTVIISICDNDFEYGYEYLGVKERLVMTSLTDICYVALTQAVGMNCGGAPAGPAGTGKTETTKDLGATLGKYVVVFNCSDQLDHHMMGRIFKGLAQAGFWGCFDEFNRIDLDVLSVCAQQLNCVFTALKERKKSLVFTDGDIIPIHPDVGYFITMNPGYAGRQELPENLKALFRGVTMMAPDRRMIMKVKLAAAGFQESETISRKFDCLYTLCEQQLSKQPHYDFGLRNILSVLRTAGAAKRANPDVAEITLMTKTLYDMNVSKFVSDDVSRFMGLINDVFPSTGGSQISMNGFSKELKLICKDEGLQCHEDWLEKCTQLYESSIVRHGIMVVGPPRSGKSTAIDAVAKTLTRMGHKTSIWKMNPKSITAPQMFGKLDAATGDWTDGIFSMLWKKAAKASHSVWIVVDGPVDAVWIENLNTVLDDNKVLTLANGDRVRMTPNMRLIFEAENLNNASPATVSRAGVVFMSPDALGWHPIFQSYSQKISLPSNVNDFVVQMIEGALTTLKACKITCDVGSAIMTESFITYLDGFAALNPDFADILIKKENDGVSEVVGNVLAFCVVWGFSGTLSRVSRVDFSQQFRRCLPSSDFFAEDESIHDYVYNIKSSTWVKWEIPDILTGIAERVDFSSVAVHTLEEARCKYLMDLAIAAGKIPHIVGPQGSGKTTLLRQYCQYKVHENFQSNMITFSSLTSPQMYQESFESYLEKRQGRHYGPFGGDRMILALDDISMPLKNAWGDQVTNELVRQIFELKGFYRLDKPIGEFKSLSDIYYLTSSKLERGFQVPRRLLGIMCSIYVDHPEVEDTEHIVNGMIEIYLSIHDIEEEKRKVIKNLGKLVVSICNQRTEGDKASPDNCYHTSAHHNACVIIRSILSKLYRPDLLSPDEIVLLCAHECEREMVDKLRSRSEIKGIATFVQKAVYENNPHTSQVERLFFSSFFRNPENGRSACYLPVVDFKETKSAIEKALQKNRELSGSLVLFDDAIDHIIRISRVLEMERRSALLVGVGGSGKKSLAMVAAASTDSKFIQASKGAGYTVGNFFEDLRNGMRECGIKGNSICFMLSDSDISDEIMLDYVNQQLMNGRIAGIFQKEDMDSILADIRPVFRDQQGQKQDSEQNLFNFFWERVSKYFHFVFCFSPSGQNLATWLKQFPGLLSCCTIDWFHPWPFEALNSLSRRILYPAIRESSTISPDELSEVTSKIHSLMSDLTENYHQDTGRRVHVTPKSYLTFLDSIISLYRQKAKGMQEYLESLGNGLQKMKEAKTQVDEMKNDLKEKQAILSKSESEIGALIEQVDKSTREATIERQKVQKIVSRVTAKADEILKTKLEAERDLEKAKPALDSAVEALNSISSKDINSMKSLRKPPDVIKRIMDCVLILYHSPISKINWHEVKDNMVIMASYEESLKLMNDLSFLQKLLTFPKEEINDETVELLQPYFRSVDFNYSSAKKASGNVAGLCNWAEAMCKYHIVARDVEPKIIRLKESEKELSVAQDEQSKAEEELAKVESTLNSLNANLSDAKREMSQIQEDAEKTEMKMNNAVKLIESLGGEEIRWQSLYENSQLQLQSLLGDCLMACTFTTYLGPIGVSHRDLYLKKIDKICKDCLIEVGENFKAVDFLADGEQVSKWLNEGLPADEFSIQNGVLLTSSNSVPYIIDPQGQCTKWLQQKYPQNISMPLSSSKFDETLEMCLARGLPFLVQNAELEFSTTLNSVLDNNSDEFVKIGEREIEIADGFKVILITRVANPDISPEKFAKCTVLNFAVTFDGLEEQFLDFIVSRDESHLNQKRQSIDEDVRQCENSMKQLEIDLLKRLSSHKGDILEDTHLVGVLAETKATAERVLSQLKEASETKKMIAERCEEYRPCSRIAALLYFSLCDFSSLNHMYKTSLEQFKMWFSDSIGSAKMSDNVSERVQNVLKELKITVYEKAQIGIFERDKDPFRFLLASRILQAQDDSGEVLDILGAILSMGKMPIKSKRKIKEWLSEEQWRNILHLQQNSKCFSNLTSSITSDESKWKAWIRSEVPEKSQSPLHSLLTSSLSHLALIRALRPEKSKSAMAYFVENALGENFLFSRGADLGEIALATTFKTPIVCVISPGADPTSKIQDLARKMKIKCLNISMGQGQEIVARKYLSTAEQRGDWVCIQNAHLAGSYLKELEDHMDNLKKTDPNFRLWITTEPSDTFPLGLLHMSLRITCEPPSGLHDALVSLVTSFDNDTLDEVKMPQWKPLLLSLNVMHVLSQERKRFGAIGWVVPYEFSYTDLASSLNIVSSHLQTLRGRKSNAINWESLHYLIGSIQYGGRIIDERDQRLMMAYCKRFLSNDVLNGSIELLNGQKFPKVSHLYKIQVTHESSLEEMIQNVEKLPTYDMPQIFGLDASAEIASQIMSVENRFDSIRSIMKTSGDAGNQEQEKKEAISRTVDNIVNTIEATMNWSHTHDGLSSGPLAAFLETERQILRSMSSMVSRDVSSLNDVLHGHKGASDQTLMILDSIQNGKVPAHWSTNYRWRLDSIDSWLKTLNLCQEHLDSSIHRYNSHCVWIPGIANPKAILNGILQEHVRSSKDSNIKIDQLEIQYQVTKIQDGKSIKDAPKTGVYLYGCFLDGAAWDPQSAKLAASKEVSVKAFPVIHAFAAVKSPMKKKKNIFLTPLYSSESRSASSFIDYIPLPTDGDDVYWAQRGAALICKT